LLVFISVSVKGQVYQLMTQYGYEAKRMNFDSTLQIPTVCGVPTLKSVVLPTKKAAIAFDSCNNRFYTYNPKTQTWSQVSGGSSTDTTSLSNRINQKVDSLTKSNDTVYYWKSGTKYFAFKDSDVTPTLQQVTDAGATTTNTIEINALSSLLKLGYWNLTGSGIYYPIKEVDVNGGEFYVKTIDGDGGVYPELKIATDGSTNTYAKLDAASLELKGTTGEAAVQLRKQNQATTAVTDTLYFPDNDGALDTIATMRYARGMKIDTTGAFLISVSQPNDSTLTFQKGATATSYTIRTAVAVSATRLVTAVFNNSGSTIPKGSVIYINGRHSSNLPTIALAQANNEENSYTTYALVENDILDQSSGVVIQAGTITNLNLPTSSYTDGQVLYLSPTVAGGYTTTKPLAPSHIVKIGTVTRAHPTFGTIQLKIENAWQLDELSDVSIPVVPADSVLLQFSRVDSLWHDVSVTAAIGNNYIKPADTSVFQRKNIAAYSFKANATNAAANVTDQAYYNPGVQTYSGTITWTGTTAPSGTTNHSYNWQRIGNMVTLNIILNYGTAGSALTAVSMALPADCPAPKEASGLGAASDILYFATGQMTTATNASNSNLNRAGLRVNAADTGNEIFVSTSSGAYRFVNITVQYFVN